MHRPIECWKFFKCNKKECPVYKSKLHRCWIVTGTHCRDEIQGRFLEKIEMCLKCKIFKTNMDQASLKETLKIVNKQFKEFRRIVHQRDRELEKMSLELALGLSEVFEALRRISQGEPTVRLSETSKIELIKKLKHVVNKTAKNITEIVDMSHEFAIGLAELFDVMHKVSKGDLNARISGISHIELMESLKKITNDMIENVSREISERKKAEDNLMKEKSFTELALNSLPGVFYLISEKGQYVKWNHNLEVVSRYSAEEISKMNPLDLFDGEDRKLIDMKIKEVFTQGQVVAEAELVSKNGSRIPYLFTGLKFTLDNQNYLIGMGIDITERKRAEKALKEKEEREDLILKSLPLVFYTARPFDDLGWIWLSGQIHRLSGFRREEYLKNPHLWISRIHPDDREQVSRDFESIQDRRTIFTEYRWKLADGSYNWFRDHAVLIKNEKGEPKEIVGTLVDITDRKRAEEALRTLSLADELTGLYNRRGFFTIAEQ